MIHHAANHLFYIILPFWGLKVKHFLKGVT
nr:MAG TPA: hypothetical protein [Bacteriophage sp.]